MWLLLTMMALAQRGELLAQQYSAATKQQIHVENLKTASKSLDFVNKMREDLRRDNDDYELLERQNQLDEPPLPAHLAPKQPNRKRLPLANRLLPPMRADLPQYNYDSRRGKGDVNQDVVIQGRVNLDTVNQSDLNQGDVNQGDVNQGNVYQGGVTQSATDFRTFTFAKHAKSLRVSKLKKLLQRDKDKLRVQDTKLNESGDMKSVTLTTTTPFRLATPAPPSPTPPHRMRIPRPSANLRNEMNLREEKHSPFRQNLKRQNPLNENIETQDHHGEDTEKQSPLHDDMEKQSPLHEDLEKQSPPGENTEKLSLLHEETETESPSREVMKRQNLPRRPMRNPAPLPDQIDMAHARNPLITRIRLKGRLCQRSLMNVEGPTYDREGKQLLPEHDPRFARGRLFHQTRAPDLVLPKCCNCCKKSVLGCQ